MNRAIALRLAYPGSPRTARTIPRMPPPSFYERDTKTMGQIIHLKKRTELTAPAWRDVSLTHRTPPLAHGYSDDSWYVMITSGRAHRRGMAANPTSAYKFPAAFNDGSTPNGPPARTGSERMQRRGERGKAVRATTAGDRSSSRCAPRAATRTARVEEEDHGQRGRRQRRGLRRRRLRRRRGPRRRFFVGGGGGGGGGLGVRRRRRPVLDRVAQRPGRPLAGRGRRRLGGRSAGRRPERVDPVDPVVRRTGRRRQRRVGDGAGQPGGDGAGRRWADAVVPAAADGGEQRRGQAIVGVGVSVHRRVESQYES